MNATSKRGGTETPIYRAWKHGIVCLDDHIYGRYLAGWAPYAANCCCYCGEEHDLFVVESVDHWEDGSLGYHGVNLVCTPCMTRFPNVVNLRFQSLASGLQDCIAEIEELTKLLQGGSE